MPPPLLVSFWSGARQQHSRRFRVVFPPGVRVLFSINANRVVLLTVRRIIKTKVPNGRNRLRQKRKILFAVIANRNKKNRQLARAIFKTSRRTSDSRNTTVRILNHRPTRSSSIPRRAKNDPAPTRPSHRSPDGRCRFTPAAFGFIGPRRRTRGDSFGRPSHGPSRTDWAARVVVVARTPNTERFVVESETTHARTRVRESATVRRCRVLRSPRTSRETPLYSRRVSSSQRRPRRHSPPVLLRFLPLLLLLFFFRTPRRTRIVSVRAAVYTAVSPPGGRGGLQSTGKRVDRKLCFCRLKFVKNDQTSDNTPITTVVDVIESWFRLPARQLW